MKAARLHVLPAFGRTPMLVWTGQVVPVRHVEAHPNWTEHAARHKTRNQSNKLHPVLSHHRGVVPAVKLTLFFFFTISFSSLMDRLYSQEDVHKHTHIHTAHTHTRYLHNGFEGEQCVLLAFIAIRHASFAVMTRHLVSLFTASQTPRAIPRITSMQTLVVSP